MKMRLGIYLAYSASGLVYLLVRYLFLQRFIYDRRGLMYKMACHIGLENFLKKQPSLQTYFFRHFEKYVIYYD